MIRICDHQILTLITIIISALNFPNFILWICPHMSESYQFHHEEYYVPIEVLSKHIIFDTVNKGYGDIRK